MKENLEKSVSGAFALVALLYVSLAMEDSQWVLLGSIIVPLFVLIVPGYATMVWIKTTPALKYGLTIPISITLGLFAAWISVKTGNGDSLMFQQLLGVAAALSLVTYTVVTAHRTPPRKLQNPTILEPADVEPVE